MKKVLFICKQRPARYGASYGLLNSCRFLCNALNSMGVDAHLVEVTDNNQIDRVVHKHRPTHVFVEALWVVPDKFNVLIPLHPNVQWYVRLHSNMPFLANEGMAIEWLKSYSNLQEKYSQFHISSNSEEMLVELTRGMNIDAAYAPNIYQPFKTGETFVAEPEEKNDHVLQVGCFGAIRPMKNQLIQACAAIAFADELERTLHFHINYSRIETNGDNAHKNMAALFRGSKHKLIEHDWMPHEKFLRLVKKMDLGLQVSFSETFNIVAADFAFVNVPIIGSPDIKWLSAIYQANPTDLNNIVHRMGCAFTGRRVDMQLANKHGLERYNHAAKKAWKLLLDV